MQGRSVGRLLFVSGRRIPAAIMSEDKCFIFSNGLKSLAAKSNKNGLWECMPQHLSDTAGVMKLMCDPLSGWVSPAFIKATGLDEDTFRKVCVFVAAVHDIGKETPEFQQKIAFSLRGLKERLLTLGLDIDVRKDGDNYYHAFISGAILKHIFGIEETVCEVVAAHHGAPREKSMRWSRPFKFFTEKTCGKNYEFEPLWEETVRYAEFVSGIGRNELPKLSLGAQILLTGLLILADWVSSNELYFPLDEPWKAMYENDADRPKRGYEASGIKRGWYPQTFMYDDELFRDRFGFAPNSLQKAAGAAVNAGAKFMIIEGIMGSGKTEAAFMCSEVMASNSASGGFYIGLPTMATSNGLFPRMLKWASEASCHLPVTAGLSHGGALFNEEYKALMVNAGENEPDNISVNQWMTGRHRKIMSDFVDGTIDQALYMALNRKYFMMLHSQIAGKAVVFDEIHSYDAYTNGYIYTTLAYLGLYGCPTTLLSATLTEKKKEEFIRAYTGDRNLEIPKSRVYPCITWWDGEKIHVDAIMDVNAKPKKIHIQKTDVSEIANTLKDKLSDGGCAGIIRNTVKSAIATYRLMKENMQDYRIFLLHSRFLDDDRNARENEIIRLVGKNSTKEDRNRLIIVGTQVLEQSLDLDFDILFTDLCPMDLLFQRTGRKGRHERERPEKLTDAEVYIITGKGGRVGGNGLPYENYILNRTADVIEETGGVITTPDDVKQMIEKTYDESIADDSPDYEHYKNRAKEKMLGSTRLRITDPWNIDIISLFAATKAAAVDDNGGVRDGNNSVRAIMLKIKDDRVMDVNETVSCCIGSLPDEHTGDIFLRQTITVPRHMIPTSEMINMKEKTGFGNESLWKYKDMIILDENNCYECMTENGKKKYCYSKETGLSEAE